MKRRVHIDLILDSEATADQLIQFVKDKLATLDVFDVISVQKTYTMEGVFQGLSAQVRLNKEIDADTLKDWIKDKWSSGKLKNKILAGSQVALHTCPHEEVEGNWYPCKEDVVVVK